MGLIHQSDFIILNAGISLFCFELLKFSTYACYNYMDCSSKSDLEFRRHRLYEYH